MTNKVENNRVHEVVETPKNEVIETTLLTAITTLNSADTDRLVLDVISNGICNNLVHEFKGFTAKTYKTKMKTMFDKSNLYYKAKKGVVRNDAIKLGQTAQTVVSTTKRFILAGQEVTAKTSYSEIKEYFKAEKVVLSKSRKEQNKIIAKMGDKKVTLMLKLLREHEQKEQEILDAKNPEIKEVIKARITKKPLIKKLKGRMANAV